MKKLTVLLMCVCCVFTAQAQKQFTLNSPGGNLQTTITIGDQLTYDITCDGRQILAPSPIAMSLATEKYGVRKRNCPVLPGKVLIVWCLLPSIVPMN